MDNTLIPMVIQTAGALAVALVPLIIGIELKAYNDRNKLAAGSLRAYYAEVCKNLDVLAALDIKSLKDEEINSPVFREIVHALETKAAAKLLHSDTGAKQNVISLLSRPLYIKGEASQGLAIESGDDDSGETAPPVYERKVNVLKAMQFTLHKIELLKTLSKFEHSSLGSRFRLNVRMYNITERLRQIRKQLAAFEAVEAVTRRR
jgi:hypothetical protein